MPLFRSKPFGRLNTALAGLGALAPMMAPKPHQPLARGIWMSYEEHTGVDLSLHGAGEGGLALELTTIGRSDWLSLSFHLPKRQLRHGRYLGLVVRTRSDHFISYRPCLRYVKRPGVFEDQFYRDYIVAAGGNDEHVSVLPIDAGKVAQSVDSEAHLFFHGTRFALELPHIEAILIP